MPACLSSKPIAEFISELTWGKFSLYSLRPLLMELLNFSTFFYSLCIKKSLVLAAFDDRKKCLCGLVV